jgi:hypothetical protein
VAKGTGRLDLRRIYGEFPNLDPDVLLRYRTIAEHVPLGAAILEVGRGEVGMAHLLGAPVVTCDILPASRRAPGEAFVRASGTTLPFRGSSFDAVVAVDVLEHLPRDRRPLFLREAARVSRGMVLLAVPTDESGPAEARHRALLKSARRTPNPWLEEHREWGLPSEREILEGIPRGWQIDRVPNMNLLAWQTNRFLVDVIHFTPRLLARIGALLDVGRTYRTVFILRRSHRSNGEHQLRP